MLSVKPPVWETFSVRSRWILISHVPIRLSSALVDHHFVNWKGGVRLSIAEILLKLAIPSRENVALLLLF